MNTRINSIFQDYLYKGVMVIGLRSELDLSSYVELYCLNELSKSVKHFPSQTFAAFPLSWKSNTNVNMVFFQIFIEATTGIAPYTDIAIDDPLVENGRCRPTVMIKKPKVPALLVTSGITFNIHSHLAALGSI